MNLYKLYKRYTTDTLSIMIIPHTGEGIRQVKFKKYLYYTAISLILAICVTTGILLYTLIYLNNQLDIKIQDLSKLQAVNTQQVKEIQELKNKAVVVNEKLSVLTDLETQVRDLLGLRSGDVPTSKAISRSSIREHYELDMDSWTNINESPDSSTNLYFEEEYDVNMELLAAEMDKEMENLNILIDEVTGQLKLLDAKPDNTPVHGRITSKYGYRKSPFTRKQQFHYGIDIANTKGASIKAAGTGIVTFSGWNGGYGNTIIISHGYGYRSVYAHNKENLVKVGQKVTKGDVIAKLGSSGKSTGPHLHFEIHYQGKQIDPLTILDQ